MLLSPLSVLCFLCLLQSSHKSHRILSTLPFGTPFLINFPVSLVYRILSSTPYSNRNLVGSSLKNKQLPKVHESIYVLNSDARDPVATTATSKPLFYSSFLCKNHFLFEALIIPFHITLYLYLVLTYKLPVILLALWVNYSSTPTSAHHPKWFHYHLDIATLPLMQVLDLTVGDFHLHYISTVHINYHSLDLIVIGKYSFSKSLSSDISFSYFLSSHLSMQPLLKFINLVPDFSYFPTLSASWLKILP